jgi:hypothetical protein
MSENSLVYKSGDSGLVNIDQNQAGAIAEKVLAENGNLIKLTAVERKIYYLAMCDRFGLDPWSNPFDYLEQKKSGEVIGVSLYPNIRAANFKAEQRGLSVRILSRKVDITDPNCKGKYGNYEAGWAEVEVEVTDGRRTLTEVGYVEITSSLKRGDAVKKAITQARRRGILAFCGLSDGGESAIGSESYDPPMDVLNSAAPIKMIAEVIPTVDTTVYAPTLASKDQVKRFWTIANQNKWSRNAVSLLLADLGCTDEHGSVSSSFIQYENYEKTCKHLVDLTLRDEYEATIAAGTEAAA